jgi:SHS2 domain-containing protein
MVNKKIKKKFEYLDHTSEIKVKSYGKNLEEAFINLALGATNFLTDVDKVKKITEINLSISSKKIDALLYDFLEELIILIDTKGFLFAGAKNFSIKKDKSGKYSLQCSALGDHYKHYEMKGDLKAVTYSDMKIEEVNGGFEILVVYDI